MTSDRIHIKIKQDIQLKASAKAWHEGWESVSVIKLLSFILKPTLSPQCEVPRLRLQGPQFLLFLGLGNKDIRGKVRGRKKDALLSVGLHAFAVSVSIMSAILLTPAEVVPSTCSVWIQSVVFLSLAKLVSVQPPKTPASAPQGPPPQKPESQLHWSPPLSSYTVTPPIIKVND